VSKSARFAFFVVLLAGALIGASVHGASAKTYRHSHTIWFGNQTLESDDVVNGDLNVVFGNATCDGATIRGDVRTYFGQFYPVDGCQVDGEVQDLAPTSFMTLVPWPDFNASNRALAEQNSHVLRSLAYAVVVLFAFLLFPVRVRVALERVERHPGLSAAAGTLAIVAALPLAILLLLSIIGIPLIVVEAAALCAGLWIGQAAVAILVGRRLFELLRPHATPTPLGALVLGLVVVGAAEMLPAVGWVVTALVWLVGLGAVILAFVRDTKFVSFTGAPPIGGAPMRSA
jgi:hypothetical protein